MKEQRLRSGAVAFVTIALVVGADRFTKRLAIDSLRFGPPQSHLGGLVRLVYAENTGAFLSFGADLPETVRFLVFGVGVTIGLVVAAWYLWKGAPDSRLRLVLVSMIVGGGVGNLIDRLTNHGRVVDFMIVVLGPVRTGVFNVADFAITTGVIGILVESLMERRS